MKRKNPMKGIAHSNGSSYSPRYFRHVEGARDGRRTWISERRSLTRKSAALCMTIMLRPFRDINPVPAGFCE